MPRIPDGPPVHRERPPHKSVGPQHPVPVPSEPLLTKIRDAELEVFIQPEKYKPRDDLEGGLIKRDEAIERGFVVK